MVEATSLPDSVASWVAIDPALKRRAINLCAYGAVRAVSSPFVGNMSRQISVPFNSPNFDNPAPMLGIRAVGARFVSPAFQRGVRRCYRLGVP